MKLLMILDPNVGDILGPPKRTFFTFYHRLSELGWKVGEFTPQLKDYDEVGIQDIEKTYRPDVIASWDYAAVKGILPQGKCKHIPYIVFGGDYRTTPDKEWYNRFDLIIQRGPWDTENDVPSVWLPLSVNEEFFSSPLIGRKKKIVFMGNTVGRFVYARRRGAIQELEQTDIFVNKGMFSTEHYPAELRRYVGALTCTGSKNVRQPLAKHFEYGASGTAILSPFFKHKDELFGPDQCYFEYRVDCSDIVEVAREIINDTDKVKEVTDNMLKIVNKFHLDKHRLLELDLILKALIKGKSIPKKWGK